MLPLQYKLGHLSPLDFPFFYWDEEMQRKESENNTQKQQQLVSLCLPLKTCACVLGERGDEKFSLDS